MRGDIYLFDTIRCVEKEKAIPYLTKAKISEREWEQLVAEGKATKTIEHIECNGIRVRYHLI